MSIDLESAKQYIYTLDFSAITSKLSGHCGWLQDDVHTTCQLYKNYLFLLKKYPDMNFVPSEDIDEFWHHHILDTKKYQKDCLSIFGRFIHHYPYFGIDSITSQKDLENRFKTTQFYYKKEFGENIPATRSKFPPFIYSFMYKISAYTNSIKSFYETGRVKS